MSNDPRRTPLYDRHLAASARMVDFAGWQMPVQYTGVIEEHRAVRTAAGLFDVSHMGEFRVAGAGAEAFVQGLTPNDVSRLTPGRAHYNAFLTPAGTFVDDLLVYRLAADEFLIVVNAANIDGDFAWAAAAPRDGAELENVSDRYALIALQGPKTVEILRGLADVALDEIRYYHFARGRVVGREAIVSRTGYTGEDGFELFVEWAQARPLWDALAAAGESGGLVPVGLGARDTLRLEAGMTLYGNELDRTTNPYEAGLDRVVKLDKGVEFVGRAALEKVARDGVGRRLVGLIVRGRGIARHGYPVWAGDRRTGVVTSGAPSPTLGHPIAMAYVAPRDAEPGTILDVEIRDGRVPAEVVALPFYRRPA
jgi:aminomethyltransferase